ncbi:MAG: hypothetical protein JKX72_11435 [Robiginitomaculum sp.]|nr:hypothetical protein [Robiginitomaculum sp.]
MTTKSNIPSSVLFVCTLNSIRSPIAEGLLKQMVGTKSYVQSCGLEAGELNELMVSIMAEKKIDMSSHAAKTLDDLRDTNFDVVIAFTKEAKSAVQAVFDELDTDIEHWPTPDPTAGDLNVRAMMDNYRAVRDTIAMRIQKKFG